MPDPIDPVAAHIAAQTKILDEVVAALGDQPLARAPAGFNEAIGLVIWHVGGDKVAFADAFEKLCWILGIDPGPDRG